MYWGKTVLPLVPCFRQNNFFNVPLIFVKLTLKTNSLTIIKIQQLCVLLQSYYKIKIYLDSVWAPAVDVLFENRYESFRVGGEHLQFESRSVYTDSRSHRASFVLSPHTDSINLNADMRLLITRVHSHTHTNKVASAIPSQHTHRHTVVWPNWFIGYYTKAHKCTTPSDF